MRYSKKIVLLSALGSAYYKGLSCLLYFITITHFHTLNCRTLKQVPEQSQLLLVFLNTTPHRFMTYLPGMEAKHLLALSYISSSIVVRRSRDQLDNHNIDM